MRLINKTHWRTDHLRAIIQRVALEELQPAERKRMTVTIQYGHGRRLGHAPFGQKSIGQFCAWNSGRITLFVNREGVESKRDQLAHTAAHEFAHTRGMRHHEMAGPRYNWDVGWESLYAWAVEMPLEKKVVRPAPRPEEIMEKRRGVALLQLAKWLTRVKRAQTCLKRWQRRVRYYDKKAAAHGLSGRADDPGLGIPNHVSWIRALGDVSQIR